MVFLPHAAEINGDRNTDLIYSSIESNSIIWLENKGNGDFTSHIVSSTINGSISIFPSDLNRDGKMDIVSASMYDNQINWYKNNGNGEFSKQTIINNESLKQTPIFISHGDQDDVLPVKNFYQSKTYLQNNNCLFEAHELMGDTHTISPKAMTLLQKFIKKNL